MLSDRVRQAESIKYVMCSAVMAGLVREIAQGTRPLPQLVNRVAGVPEHLVIVLRERVADVPVDSRIARL